MYLKKDWDWIYKIGQFEQSKCDLKQTKYIMWFHVSYHFYYSLCIM